MNLLKANGKSFLSELHVTSKGGKRKLRNVSVGEASHIEDRNVAVVDTERKFVVVDRKSMISSQEESFDNLVEVELERK